jgi:hypothetical protein
MRMSSAFFFFFISYFLLIFEQWETTENFEIYGYGAFVRSFVFFSSFTARDDRRPQSRHHPMEGSI